MVNLLWSNPLPQPQFASLSILLQLDIPKQYSNNDDDDTANENNADKIIRNISSDEILALANNNNNNANNNNSSNSNNLKVSTTLVQLPNNGGTKEVPLYPKGLIVNYLKLSSSSSSFLPTAAHSASSDNDNNNNDNNDNDNNNNGDAEEVVPTTTTTTTTTTKEVAYSTPATILNVHYDDNLEPYYTIRLHVSGVEKQTDNSHIDYLITTTNNNTTQQPQQRHQQQREEEGKKGKEYSPLGEADNAQHPPPPPLRHAVVTETITVITPHTLLPEKSHLECMEGLHVNLMNSYGLKDDFFLGGGVVGTDDNNDEKKHYSENNGGEEEVNDDDVSDSNIMSGGDQDEDDNDLDSTMTPLIKNSYNYSKEVRFGDGTKGPTMKKAAIGSGNKGDDMKKKTGGYHTFGKNLPVRIYKPKNCLLGMTCYYLAVYAEDIPKLIEGGDNNNNDDDGADDGDSMAKALFQHCASVLVPGISLTSKYQRGGVVVLTVGSTGPPYDLFGASTVIATLPQRLREGMKQLAFVDTSPKKERLLTNDELQRQLLQQQQQPEKDGSRRFSFLGKSSTSNRSSSQQQQQQKLLQQLSQSASTTTAATTYDSAYFHRLYMALLATILDDEDGYMREHDEVVMKPYPFSPATVGVGTTPRTPSTMGGLLTDQGMTSSGTVKKNRFTFSRRKVENDQEYAFDNGGGGEGIPDFKDDDNSEGGAQSTNDVADIIRRTAQKLEVLSIAEEEMPIPRYSHLIGENEKSSGTPKTRKSPQKPSGRKGAAASSGRFGRPAVPSDLSGFEYRPSAQQRMGVGGGGGMSVSGFTTSTSEISEDASIMTGDHTAFTTSSQSSVPTLSRSKRDDSSTSSSSSRSRRFMFMKKKKEKSPKRNKKAKQPLSAIPQGQELQQQQLVYDPFGNDDGEVNNENDSLAEKEGVFQSLNSKSVPVDLDDTPPETPQKTMVNELKESYSYESEGKDSSYASAAESNASTAPESIAEPEPEPEPEPAPTRHLDVSLALNEDLTCEYKQSKLSNLTVEGTIQVRMSTSYEGEPPQDAPSSIPFVLFFKDHSGHVKTLQENKKFVENVSHESEVANREFTYTITIPREEEYFPVVRYKCDTSLRPVPIVSTTC